MPSDLATSYCAKDSSMADLDSKTAEERVAWGAVHTAR